MQLTVGQLIKKLKVRDPEQEVVFDFCRCSPTSSDSYRGYYDHLAIGWKVDSEVKVKTLLEDLQNRVGTKVHGYKGGSYTIHLDTPVWVSNYGRADDTFITGIADRSWETVLLTGFEDH